MQIKVASWNICVDNQFQIENIVYLLAKENPDVLCLQEVQADTIKRLKKHPLLAQYDIKYTKDFEKQVIRSEQKSTTFYLAIISRHRYQNHFTDVLHAVPIRTSLASRHFGIHKPRFFQYIDIHTTNANGEDIPIRIFNVHLEVSAGSHRRLLEFSRTLQLWREDGINIFCGDLNIFTRPLLNFLIGWGFKFSLKEYLVNERRAFNRLFKKYHLNNVFKKRVTFPRFRLQLDHILIPDIIHPSSSLVSKKTLDSDHSYIVTTIPLASCTKKNIIRFNRDIVHNSSKQRLRFSLKHMFIHKPAEKN